MRFADIHNLIRSAHRVLVLNAIAIGLREETKILVGQSLVSTFMGASRPLGDFLLLVRASPALATTIVDPMAPEPFSSYCIRQVCYETCKHK